MLSKEEQQAKNSAFWGNFKEYMKKTRSSNGRRINWITYPTDVQVIYVRLEAGSKGCALHFDIQHKDDGVRQIIWEQMGELRVVMQSEMNYQSSWEENYTLPNGQTISRISWINSDLNYFKEDDIPKMYEQLKKWIVSFDRFYQEYKDILITLVD